MASRIESAAVNVGDTATLLCAANIHRGTLIIHNLNAAAIFVGPSTVTTLTGIPIPQNEKIVIYSSDNDRSAGEAYYAIAAAAQTSPTNTRVLQGISL
jgi:hypothetical protein